MNYYPQNFGFLFWQTDVVPSVGWLDIFWLLIQTALALALVCGLAVLIFRYILPKLNVVSFNKSIVRVIDGTSLDARKRLLVVEVAGKYMLLASSENGVQMVSELDGEAVEKSMTEAAEAQKETQAPLKQISNSFAQVMERMKQKKS